MMELLPMWMEGLTPGMVKQAADELGETPETRPKALQELRKLINDEAGFHPVMSDWFLLRFLRWQKFNVKKSFTNLKNYYDFKSRYSGKITDFEPYQLKRILEMDKVLISPKRDSKNCGIMIVFGGSFEVEKNSPYDILATMFLAAEIGIDTAASQVCGSDLILDFEGVSLRRLSYFSTPSLLLLAARGLQKCWPFRMNSVHALRAPDYVIKTYDIIKLMLSKKISDRVHIHGHNLESLHKHIPPECLPKELGGHLRKEDFEEFRSIILSKKSLAEELNRYVYRGKPSPAFSNDVYVQRGKRLITSEA